MVISFPAPAATATPHSATPPYSPPVIEEATDGREWNAFVEAHSEATLYHRWHWRQIFAREFGRDPLYLSARRQGRIVAVLPLVCFQSRLFGRFLVSLPIVDSGGILAETDGDARALIERAREEARQRGAAHVELRHLRPIGGLPVRTHKVSMLLPLASDEDALWRALDNKVRNQVRKAGKANFEVEIGGPELADDFYTVFAVNMRDLGVPVHSKRFYTDVLSTAAGSRGFVVRDGRRPIAAGITLRYRARVENPWASSLFAYRSQCPNMLLYWAMLKTAAADGATLFDFGRSTDGSSTYRFKKQWGARPSPLNWEYVLAPGAGFPDHTTGNPKFAAAVAVWRRLPVSITRLIGPFVVRRLP